MSVLTFVYITEKHRQWLQHQWPLLSTLCHQITNCAALRPAWGQDQEQASSPLGELHVCSDLLHNLQMPVSFCTVPLAEVRFFIWGSFAFFSQASTLNLSTSFLFDLSDLQ